MLPPVRAMASAVAVTATAIVALSACSSSAPPDGSALIVGHVHGVDYDPATEGLFIASHTGLWRLDLGSLSPSSADESEFDPVAPLDMDVMGFTVTEPGRMVASGHPGPNAGGKEPANLGLLGSVDGGEKWGSISLYGEADFHDMATVMSDGELRIYGYDSTSGTIRVSENNGVDWTDGATMALRDIAASATDPDTVYATSPDGLLRSNNGAKTFAPVPDAPPLVLIDATESSSATLAGVDTEGDVWSLTRDHPTWVRKGTLGSVPQAFSIASAGDQEMLLAVTDHDVVASNNGGEHWYTLAPLIANQAG